MATTSSREARDHPFYRVRDLASKLVRHPSSYLSHDDLAMMGIEVAAMDYQNRYTSGLWSTILRSLPVQGVRRHV
jgi:hypothetical protein